MINDCTWIEDFEGKLFRFDFGGQGRTEAGQANQTLRFLVLFVPVKKTTLF